MDPGQDFVVPDLDPNSLKRLSADDKNCRQQGRTMGGSKGSWLKKDDTWHTNEEGHPMITKAHFAHVMLRRDKIGRIIAISQLRQTLPCRHAIVIYVLSLAEA